MAIKIESLESIAPGNPFLSDPVRGTIIGTNVMAMMVNFDNQPCERLVIVNTVTGERVMLHFSNDRES